MLFCRVVVQRQCRRSQPRANGELGARVDVADLVPTMCTYIILTHLLSQLLSHLLSHAYHMVRFKDHGVSQPKHALVDMQALLHGSPRLHAWKNGGQPAAVSKTAENIQLHLLATNSRDSGLGSQSQSVKPKSTAEHEGRNSLV